MTIATRNGTYQQAESGDGGEGAGHGGAGEGQLAEVADEHDGDHLDEVLHQAAGDERPGQPQLPLHLVAHGQALVLPELLAHRAPREERFLEACLLHVGLRRGLLPPHPCSMCCV